MKFYCGKFIFSDSSSFPVRCSRKGGSLEPRLAFSWAIKAQTTPSSSQPCMNRPKFREARNQSVYIDTQEYTSNVYHRRNGSGPKELLQGFKWAKSQNS